MNNKVLQSKLVNKKINNVQITSNDMKNIELMTSRENVINNWLNSQEKNNDGLKFEWNNSYNEPPKNWFNKDINKINEFINSNDNLSYENSLTPGTTIYQNKKYYNSYEDWFFDNYKPVYNKHSVKKLYNEIISILEDNNYKLNDIKSFKNNLANFIYNYSI
jgi:hypothetical protein